jgi:hypothetical protein
MTKNKVNFIMICFVLFIISINSVAQNIPDFFVGRWNILITGTPNGDAKMIITLERKDGKLGGIISFGEQAEPVKLASIDESEKSITLYFPAGGYDVRLTLGKVDDNHVSGSLMDQFDGKGERMKTDAGILNSPVAADFFTGQWNLLTAGTPNGDIKMVVSLERKDGKLAGTINIVQYATVPILKVDEKESSIVIYFSAEDHDLNISLRKKDENHVEGSEMDMFDVKGERVIK